MNTMKIANGLRFNGNCEEALALYEKAFGVKADFITRYKDAPPAENNQHPEGTENLILYTKIMLGNDEIGLWDVLPDNKHHFGNGMSIHVGFDIADEVRAAFDVLKEDGKISKEPEKVFFTECYSELTDKYGVSWILSC